MADVLIKGGHIITMNPQRHVLDRGSVVIEGDKIVSVGKKIKGRADTVIDARGKAVLPGLINAHTHLSMTLLRGIADDMELDPWLKTKIWPVEKHLRAEDCYVDALLGCMLW